MSQKIGADPQILENLGDLFGALAETTAAASWHAREQPGWLGRDAEIAQAELTELATAASALSEQMAQLGEFLRIQAQEQLTASAVAAEESPPTLLDIDQANRSLLAQNLQQLPDQAAAGGPGAARAAEGLAAALAVQAVLAKGDRQLLGYTPGQDRTRAVIAQGDLSRAERIVVFTPGMGTSVDEIESLDTEVGSLRDRATQMSPGAGTESIAAVTWLDYEPPGDVPSFGQPVDWSFADAAHPDRAQAGGQDLHRFLTDVSQQNPDAHIVAVGHSYGSTTTGYALQHPGHGVADAVFLGSPGIATSDPGKLGVDQVFVMEADGDAVADLGYFGGDPNQLDVVNLSARTSELGAGVTGHSDYLQEGSAAQGNVAAVVAGALDRLVVGADQDIGDRVRSTVADLTAPWRPGR